MTVTFILRPRAPGKIIRTCLIGFISLQYALSQFCACWIVSCSCIELLTWFSFGIGYFKCDYPDHVKPIHIVHTVFSSWLLCYSESLTLQPPLSKSLSRTTCIFSLSVFPYCSEINTIVLASLCGKRCQGRFLGHSGKRGFEPAHTHCIHHPSAFWSLPQVQTISPLGNPL